MNIFIIGSGAREHALAWKLKQSKKVQEIYVAKGNGGTFFEAKNVDIAEDNITALVDFAKSKEISLVIVGPELPLTLGIVDAMNEAGILAFGPNKFCANLEASKAFAKKIMLESGVPTAKYAEFTDYALAKEYALEQNYPLVIKADGLAAGKGVIIAQNKDEAVKTLEDILVHKKFGASGNKLIIEDFLIGEEVSLLAFCDKNVALPLPSAQDHKAVFDNDLGPNTGGMGAYSPAPILPDNKIYEMTQLCITPILNTIKKYNETFRGILYAGLMMTKEGPKVLEYNVRFGDPECQVLLMRLEDDLLDLLIASAKDELNKYKQIKVTDQSCLTIVMAAKGYPDTYVKNVKINGIDLANQTGAKVFIAGANYDANVLASTGGRVLSVTALGQSLSEAKANAYKALEKIDFPNSHYRTDIGDKGIKKLQNTTK